MRCILAGFVGVLLLGFEIQAQPPIISMPSDMASGIPGHLGTLPRWDEQKPGSAVIRGRVLADTGQPLWKAVVRTSLIAGTDKRLFATTDQQGQYQIRDLPAGRYWLTASKGLRYHR